MHTHTARTEIAKLQETLDSLMPPGDHDLGALASTPSDLVDLKVEFLGGRDVLAVAVHLDHDVASVAVGPRLVHVEQYGPDFRVTDRAFDGAVMTPDTAGLVEDDRRTWIMFYGQDGRPTLLWLYRSADGAVIGDPIDLAPRAAPTSDPVDELLEAIRLTQEYAQLPAVEGWSWYDAYRRYRPDDAERLRADADRHADRLRQPISTDEFVDDPDPMVWARAFASRFAVRSLHGVDIGHSGGAPDDDDVAGLMVGWFSNFATAWERQVRARVETEKEPARVVIIRRQDNGWDRFAFVDDNGRTVGEYTVDPRHVTVVHDRGSVEPGWVWPTG